VRLGTEAVCPLATARPLDEGLRITSASLAPRSRVATSALVCPSPAGVVPAGIAPSKPRDACFAPSGVAPSKPRDAWFAPQASPRPASPRPSDLLLQVLIRFLLLLCIELQFLLGSLAIMKLIVN
jgi:hypothetical protein